MRERPLNGRPIQRPEHLSIAKNVPVVIDVDQEGEAVNGSVNSDNEKGEDETESAYRKKGIIGSGANTRIGLRVVF